MTDNLSILNDPPKVLDGPQLLHHLIRWDEHQESCALDFTSNERREKYTYAELQSCASTLITRIEDALSTTSSSKKQHIIPILLPQSPGLYISQLAILQSGGAFCPINLDAPKERIKFVVNDVSANIIITTSDFRDVASWEEGPEVILVDEFPKIEASLSRQYPSREATPDELAYVMYTSGSSGTPKGVAVSHLAATQSLLVHEKLIPTFQRFLQFAAPSFDVSVFEIFFPMTRGCTLVGCDRSQLLNDLPGMINKLEVDAAELTPTVAGSLLQTRANAPGLKLLLTIGEMLTRPIVEEFGGSETRPSMLYGMYGPTEAAIHCTIYPAMEASTKPGNIGVPFETVSTFIAAAASGPENAADLTFLPIGELGELVLGGPQLAQGYLNREEQNKAAFVQYEGKMYYRTGDKARQLEDGTIEILGRISAGQVKLRGQRVELGEIEDAVYKHPGLKIVTAVVLTGTLIVFALVGDENIKPDDVMKTCSKWLPKFMVPNEIVLLHAFPYLPSGKVDKRKLEADYQQSRELDEAETIATTKTEQEVKNVLLGVLGRFQRSTRLATIGLDSLTAIRVASKLRSSGFHVNTVAVLQAETFRSLVDLCEDSRSEPSQPTTKPSISSSTHVTEALNGNAKDVDWTMPCTPLQAALLSETSVDRKAYRNWIELALPMNPPFDHVSEAWKTLASHNPLLRTGFAESQDSMGFLQLVWKDFPNSCIEEVNELDYSFDIVKDVSLHHPLRVQICNKGSEVKLLLHIHHALYDAWSLELLLDDFESILANTPLQERPPFRDVVDSYADGLLTSNEWASKDYWKDHLADLELRQMPSFHTLTAKSHGLAVSRLQTTIPTSAVESAARNLSTSAQSIFQAAYSLILSSYLGTSDICFGTVFSGRTLPVPGIEDIAGPCLATLPIRIDLSTSSSLQDLVRELNATTRKHLEHSTISLREIKSSSSVNPRQQLFDTLVIWQQTLHSHTHTRKHVTLVESVDNLEFNLTLEIIPGAGHIELKANYQQALFPDSQINLLLQQVEQLAKFIVEDVSQKTSTAFQRLSKQVLSIENENPEIELNEGTLSSPVERIASEDPDRPAISFATSINSEKADFEQVSYSQLNSKANQIGHGLLELGVLPDELVCVCMEKCVDMYTSFLAVAKVGAGYLPLAADVPSDRLSTILQESNVKVVVAQTASCSLLKPFSSLKVVYVDEFDFSSLSSHNIPTKSAPENLAYCVFTSGSTGAPKGVLVTQGNLLSNLDVLEEIYPASKDTRLLQSCSQAFDVSVFEIFFTWRVGGCICSAVKDVLFQDIENAIRLMNATHLSLTPTVASLINPANVPKVQFLVTAGESVTQKVFNAWADRGLWQGYGPSETTNICAVNPKATHNDAINSLGAPLRNTSAFVLCHGPEFVIAPRGAEGELCFGGSQVSRGYMDKSQEVGKIIDHPTFGRLYRTGDYGRLMPDGSLLFTGRKDDQVKIRGQRVELSEINAIILKSVEVGDCFTMVVNGKNGNSQQLVCFWTLNHETKQNLECLSPNPCSITKLYQSLESSLPSYMVPSALIPILHLPATTQGKIDKRALAKLFSELDIQYLEKASRTGEAESDRSWTEIQRKIAEVVANITGVDLNEIGPNTSFFNLGIDSISAISLSRVLRQTLNLPTEISDILKHPSVTRLSELLESRGNGANSIVAALSKDFDFRFNKEFVFSTTSDFEQHGKMVEKILPCTPLQEAMLSAANSSSEALYENQVTFDIAGDIEKLQECWQHMVIRHEILRTCFVSTDSPKHPFAQVVLKDYTLKFGKASSEIGTSQTNFIPPYSLDMVESLGIRKLVISMNHALYDGVALSILYEEVETLYRGKTLPSPRSFAPFLQSMVSANTDDADQFWSAQLKGCHSTRFAVAQKADQVLGKSLTPTRIQRANVQSPLSWIDEHTRKHSTTLLAACHTAWASLLSEVLQETDICFGNVVSGRTLPVDGIERLVAPCFNTIPARLQNIHKISYLEAFRKLQNFNADSLPFHLTPLRRLQSKFSPDGSRLFDTLFILQQPAKGLDPEIWSISDDSGAMDFPLVCEVVPRARNDTLEIVLHSYTSAISDEEGSRLLAAFEGKLRAGLQNPRRSLLSAPTREQILRKIESREAVEASASKEVSSSTTMSPGEQKLRDVIASFTDVPANKIGPHVSIFRLGLDSISTVQVAARLRKEGHNVMASDILENPTISKLYAFLNQTNGAATIVPDFDFAAFDKEHRDLICPKNNLDSSNIESIRPCTSVQQGMLAQTLHSGGKEYMNSVWFECLPDIDLPRLKNAWKAVFEKHEMLRTGFIQTEISKFLFIMITFHHDGFELPWHDHGEDKWNQMPIAEKLTTKPWSISTSTENCKTILRLTAHHALYDAQSIQLILSDVGQQYFSGSCDQPPPVATLLGAILQASSEGIETKQAFWSKEENKIIVNRFPDLSPLQVENPMSHVNEIHSRASAIELEKLCRQNGVTMQAAAQASWARLLTAYIGEVSTTFGMTLSGRSVNEVADKVGFPSIVTLPVRCSVMGTNAELLSRTMETNALLHKHQFTPLTSIQKWAGYPEGKIFDTLFAYQKLPEGSDEPQMPWKIVREEASVDYAVSMEVQPSGSDELTLRLTFRDDLIPTEHAEILLQQYDALLLDTLNNPQNPCDKALAIDHELLSITSAIEKELPAPVNLLHEFVERGAIEWPDKIAFEFATNLDPENLERRSWSYVELNQEANKIAHLLLQREVVPGQMIAVCFDKCPEASFAIVGILKAGCAYVALDPNAPADRLKFIIEDSGAKLVLSAGKPAKNLEPLVEDGLIPLDAPEILDRLATTQPRLSRSVLPEDVAYCLYTSGTTGTPKGCLITHDNTVQFMLAFSELFAGHWNDNSKYLQFASFHFDVSVMEQFWSWSIGICVASAPRDLIFEDIAGAINALGITNIDLTPSLARLLRPEDVPTLAKGAFITGGEQLKQEILDVWGELAVIYNGYGPTEVTIGCTMFPRVPKNGKPANIGPAYINAGTYVMKPGTELPVLRGGVGELCVSGKLVGKGYLNRPDLTAEKFPTLKTFNERVYRTGDLVRILHDGCFIFLGRADDQVKLRGQRLELSEINEVIKKSSKAIEEVVTLVLKHTTQQKEQLVTFFVTSAAAAQERGELISTMKVACKSRLPGYMVPTHFIPIKSTPLNPNNKADSKQLAAMYSEMGVEELQKLSRSGEEEKEWTEQERRILEVVAEAIGVEMDLLKRGSNIFELGLDSISIIGFSRALQNSGLENAKLSVVKSNPSINNLIQALLDKQTPNQSTENAYIAASQNISAFEQKHKLTVCKELGIDSEEIEAIVPCTPVQEGMIYRFLESEKALYFNEFVFELEEGVDKKRLLESWERVVEETEVMRMRFVECGEGVLGVVLKEGWEREGVEYDEVEKEVALKTPWSLVLSGDVLTLKIFHGLYDGNSLEMLLRCVVDEYHGLEDVAYGPSFVSSLPYGPLAKLDGARDFWISHLKEWTAQSLPIIAQSNVDMSVSSTIENLDALEQLRKQLGVTPQSLVQALWLATLQSLLGPNLTIGIVTSGRAIDFPNADKVIGPLFNTVPCRMNIKSGINAESLVRECHEFNMKMQEYQHTPLKDIQKWMGIKGGGGLFESLFVFQRPEVGGDEFSEGLWMVRDGDQVADYPLAFEANLSPNSKTLGLTIVAQGNFVTKDRANSLLERFTELLHATLNESGKNIVGGQDEGRQLADGKELDHRNGGPSVTSSPELPHGSFLWTKEATTIRDEIAFLAGMSEENIHPTSSIFELGLDSIDVIKLSSRLKKRQIEIPVSAIIKSQSIAKMSLSIKSKTVATMPKSVNPFKDLCDLLTKYMAKQRQLHPYVQMVLPATPLQQSMVNNMIESGYERYFTIEAFKLRDGVVERKLLEAIETVVRKYPILRTTFVPVHDPELPVSFAQVVHQYSHTPGHIKEYPVVKWAQESNQDFDYQDVLVDLKKKKEFLSHAKETKDLFQFGCVSRRDCKYLIIVISHALYDGASLRALHEDIQRAYEGKLSPRPDFIPFLEEVFASTTEDAKNFWKTRLSKLPNATLPRRELSDSVERLRSLRIEKQSTFALKDIEAFCKKSKITLQTLGQTCWALVLSHFSNQLDVVFGTVLSCRDSEDANEVMFPLMNTVAVRSVIHGTGNEMLSYMQEMSDKTREYQHFPLGMAQAFALADSERKNATLFDSLFIYQGKRQVMEGEQLYDSVYGNSDVEFPVCVEMEIVDEEIWWTTKCKSIVADREETKGLVVALERVLEKILKSPEEQVINTNADGASVCGLPRFRMAEQEEKKSKANRAQEGLKGDDDWTATELGIRKALHELSHAPEETIQKRSTIFHLGLDSILILKLPALLKKIGIKLTVSDILRELTVVDMAICAEYSAQKAEEDLNVDEAISYSLEGLSFAAAREALEKEVGEIQEILPVMPGQLFMIRKWQATQGAMFHQVFTYEIPAPINRRKLERAWNELLHRHAILRTGFIEIQGKVVQVVFKNPENRMFALNHHSYGGTLLAKNRSDLRAPPLNLVLEKTGENAVKMSILIHHALYDGVNLPIILEDFQDLYMENILPSPEFDFRTFVARTVNSTYDTKTKDKWLNYLGCGKSKAKEQQLPSYQTSDEANPSRRTEVFHPNCNLPRFIPQMPRDENASIDSYFLAWTAKIYATEIFKANQKKPKSIILGVYLANRAPFDEDVSELVAPTLNLLPLVVKNPLKRDVFEMARQIGSDLAMIGGMDMVGTSLQDIFEWTGVEVQLWVNILKGTKNTYEEGVKGAWKAQMDMGKREVILRDKIVKEMPKKVFRGYIPSIDIEIRYDPKQEKKIDVGVFAPCELLTVEQGREWIGFFVSAL